MSADPSTDWRVLNRANWDERVGVHTGPRGYDLSALKAGGERLNAIEEAELGPVAGLRVIHLQCHFGRDSLILAERGARVTGVDFSGPAIATARELAAAMQLDARVVESDLYDAPAAIGQAGGFDLAYVTWGTVCWLPDIAGWARVVAHFLRPGGALYFADAHPAALVFDDDAGADPQGRPGWLLPYFQQGGAVLESAADYLDTEARLTNTRTVQFMHPLGNILAALRDAGLRLDWLREHPRATWKMFGCLVEDADGCWIWPDRAWLPLSISLRAVREA